MIRSARTRPEPTRDSGSALVRVAGLSKRIRGQSVLDGIDLEIRSGERVAVLGLNGAGKTTLFRCLLGVTPHEGTIEVGGETVRAVAAETRRRIGYVPQRPPRFDLTLREFIRIFAALRDIEAPSVERRLAYLGLEVERHGHKRLAALSGGMLQKAVLALALESDCRLLLLDEPTANLDAAARADFLSALGQVGSGTAILLASHRLDDIETLADRQLLLHDGRLLFDGSATDLYRRSGIGPELALAVDPTARDRALERLRGYEAVRTLDHDGALISVEVAPGSEHDVAARLHVDGIRARVFSTGPPALPRVVDALVGSRGTSGGDR